MFGDLYKDAKSRELEPQHQQAPAGDLFLKRNTFDHYLVTMLHSTKNIRTILACLPTVAAWASEPPEMPTPPLPQAEHDAVHLSKPQLVVCTTRILDTSDMMNGAYPSSPRRVGLLGRPAAQPRHSQNRHNDDEAREWLVPFPQKIRDMSL